MLTVYIVTGIVGLVLTAVAAIAGFDHGTDHEFDVGADVGGDVGHDVGHDADHDAGHDGLGAWLPFLSLRFWTFFAAGFGTIGAVLTLFEPGNVLIPVWAVAGGLGIGLLVSWGVRVLQRHDAANVMSQRELLGAAGKLLVAIRPGQPGKVRVIAQGEIIDMIATSQNDKELESGEEVFVVDVDGRQAVVAQRRDLFGDDESEATAQS